MRRIGPLGLSNQIALRYAAPHQVVAAYSTFAETRGQPRPACCDDNRRYTLGKELKSMIQARPKNRRRTSGIFGSAKNHDSVGSAKLVLIGRLDDPRRYHGKRKRENHHNR